jgi:hypothetical protein
MGVAGAWQPVPAEQLVVAAPNAAMGTTAGVHAGQATWTPPPGSRPVAIRATLLDLAGNLATYQAPIATAAVDSMAATPPASDVITPPAPAASQLPPSGWISSSAATSQASPAPASQPWPAVAHHRSPFRLFSSGPSLPDDGITAYGNPPAITPAETGDGILEREDHRVAARFAPSFTALEPFRQASVSRFTDTGAADTTSTAGVPPSASHPPAHTPPMEPKLVGSRTFALEYDLDDRGRWGVSKVELWGTRDGGQTWHCFARDDDYRSPLVVTVDEEGLYGFRIVVESAGSVLQPPVSGDEPELWVAVDLHRPIIEMTAIERGAGNLVDHLILRWQASDDNLEARPISLFYSCRPTGPWSAIATNLEDTGAYAWRVERHVPARLYLRIEARDTAGNLAAFQTREPIEFDPHEPSGELRDAESIGPTATGIEASYR